MNAVRSIRTPHVFRYNGYTQRSPAFKLRYFSHGSHTEMQIPSIRHASFAISSMRVVIPVLGRHNIRTESPVFQ